MQFTKTLATVREQVESDDAPKWDALVPCRELCACYGRLAFPQATEQGFEGGLAPSPWALSQLCQKLGIPAGYLRKCPPNLQDQNLNYWLYSEEVGRRFEQADTDPEAAWLLRCSGGLLRGVLSSRYARLDNADLLEALLPLVSGTRFQVGLSQLTPESFHLRLIDPTIARDVLPGDRLMAGIHLANSEVGLRALSVDAMVFRLVCTNGMIRRIGGKSLMRQRHIHVSEPRFASLLAESLSEAVTVAAGLIEQLSLSTHAFLPDPEAAVELLGESWTLSQSVQEQVRLALLAERPESSLYALVNALTLVGQRLPPDDRLELETRAGSLVEMSGQSAGSALRQRLLTASPRAASPRAASSRN